MWRSLELAILAEPCHLAPMAAVYGTAAPNEKEMADARRPGHSKEALRAAIIHLLDLAACWENRGDRDDDAASAVLTEVVDRLLSSLADQRNRAALARARDLIDDLSNVYTSTRALGTTAYVQQQQVSVTLAAHGIEATNARLDAAVLTSEEIKDEMGPVLAASKVVASLLAVPERTIHDQRRRSRARKLTGPPMTGWNLRMGRFGLVRYALRVLRVAPELVEIILRENSRQISLPCGETTRDGGSDNGDGTVTTRARLRGSRFWTSG